MHVLWKRPDGFHNARPSDYKVVELSGQSQLWLHNTDRKWFPFRISGGWQESEATQKLNQLVNLVGESNINWVTHVTKLYSHTLGSDAGHFVDDLCGWLNDLRNHLKGDTWETEIMDQVIGAVQRHLLVIKPQFLQVAAKEVPSMTQSE